MRTITLLFGAIVFLSISSCTSAIDIYENSGHNISIERAEEMHKNYTSLLKPEIENFQRKRIPLKTNEELRKEYSETTYLWMPLEDLKNYIKFLEEVQKLNPKQPDISGVIIAFGAYNMGYVPKNDLREQIGIDNIIKPSKFEDPVRLGDHEGRLNVFLGPTFYDNGPTAYKEKELDILNHRPFYIIKNNGSENKYIGTFKAAPFLNPQLKANITLNSIFRNGIFDLNDVGGPNTEDHFFENMSFYMDHENTSLFYNELNTIPPMTGPKI